MESQTQWLKCTELSDIVQSSTFGHVTDVATYCNILATKFSLQEELSLIA